MWVNKIRNSLGFYALFEPIWINCHSLIGVISFLLKELFYFIWSEKCYFILFGLKLGLSWDGRRLFGHAFKMYDRFETCIFSSTTIVCKIEHI